MRDLRDNLRTPFTGGAEAHGGTRTGAAGEAGSEGKWRKFEAYQRVALKETEALLVGFCLWVLVLLGSALFDIDGI